jgi:hypothetical protein
MREIKYGMNEVFDFYIYDTTGMIAKLDSVKSNKISIRNDGFIYLEIEDVLLDMDFIDYAFSTDIQNKPLRIVGKSVVRDVIDCTDHPVRLTVTITKLEDFNLTVSVGEPATMSLIFKMPKDDCYGFTNMMFDVDREV